MYLYLKIHGIICLESQLVTVSYLPGNTTISKADSYRQANKEGKQGCNESSGTAKARAMNELYEELETPECERKISDSEGQGFHQEQLDKGRTSGTFKEPG